ncbi:ABC transporter permease [Brucellaceae bacterium C25G]
MTTVVQTATAPAPRKKSRVWIKFKSNRSAVLGCFVVLFFVLVALLGPLFPLADPIQTSWTAIRQPPSAAHWLGTDELGRDIFSRMIYGARASLQAGVISVMIAVALGLPLGMLAGYFGGWTDQVIARITDAMLALPFLIMAIALAAFMGPSLNNAMIAIGLSAMPVFIRLTRGQAMSVRTEEYVDAARAIGLSHIRIMTRYILPNIFAPVLVQATLTIATAIIAEASLSFLGLGQQAPAPSWGSMLATAKNFLTQAPYMAIWPGLAIFLVVMAFNLLGDGLRDALDPRDNG